MTEDSKKVEPSNGNDGFVWSTDEGIVSGPKAPDKPKVIVKSPKLEEPKNPPSK